MKDIVPIEGVIVIERSAPSPMWKSAPTAPCECEYAHALEELLKSNMRLQEENAEIRRQVERAIKLLEEK